MAATLWNSTGLPLAGLSHLAHRWQSLESLAASLVQAGLAIAFLSLPTALLITLLRRHTLLPCNWSLGLSLASALCLGLSFALNAVWAPTLPLILVSFQAIAALATLLTAACFLRHLPQILALPSANQLALVNQVLQNEVNERRRAEAALTQLNLELEARVEQRTAALSETLSRLQQSEAELIAKNQELCQALTELKNAQSQLIHSEKMISLGHLAAGIAHEINNPISFIYGNLGHLHAYTQDLIEILCHYQQEFPHPSPALALRCEELDLEFVTADLPRLLASINTGTERIRDLVNSLRDFACLDEADIKSAQIEHGLESSLRLLQHRLHATPQRPEIQVLTDYAPLPPLECYPSQLNQVFAHLLTNAIDALDRCADGSPGPPPCIQITTRLVDDWLEVTIADNGPGFDEQTGHHLFDPFFTTKPVGQGRGLGLSLSYQFVTENHGGELSARSLPTGGAEFRVRLPRHSTIRAPQASEQPSAQAVRS